VTVPNDKRAFAATSAAKLEAVPELDSVSKEVVLQVAALESHIDEL
jgi:hypothetical protein